MGEANAVTTNERQDPRAIAPDLVRAYEIALSNQHILFALESASLQQARCEDYLRIEATSIQFASEVKMSMEYTQLSAK